MAHQKSSAWWAVVLSTILSSRCPSLAAKPAPSWVGAKTSVAVPDHSAASMEGELTTRLKGLFQRWKAVPSSQWAAKSVPIRGEVDSAVSEYTARRLSNPERPSAPNLQQEINDALAAAIWESIFGMSAGDLGAALGHNPPRFGFVLQGAGSASDLYVTGFGFGYGNTYSASIHGFTESHGRYAVVGTAGAELDGSLPQGIVLRPFEAHELRFLAWGLHIGSPEGLTSVVLYAFDGQRLRVLWRQSSLPRAEVSIVDGQVVIESEYLVSAGKGAWERQRDVYRQVPQGLRLSKTKRWTTQ